MVEQWCGTYRKNGASADWPSQAVYLRQILAALTSANACLNTSFARDTVGWLDTMQTASAATTGNFFWTWLAFQAQYYDMPRKPGERVWVANYGTSKLQANLRTIPSVLFVFCCKTL